MTVLHFQQNFKGNHKIIEIEYNFQASGVEKSLKKPKTQINPKSLGRKKRITKTIRKHKVRKSEHRNNHNKYIWINSKDKRYLPSKDTDKMKAKYGKEHTGQI